MAPRLKVYTSRIGFHDVAVAAPNQKAALAAWDVRENLFASGAAAPTEDPDAAAPALAEPGVVISRAIGAKGRFTVQAKTPASAPTASRPKSGKAAPKPKPVKAPRRDRGPLDSAEAAVKALDAEQHRALAEVEQERKNLESREAGVRRAFASRRRMLERERDRARRVYEDGGA